MIAFPKMSQKSTDSVVYGLGCGAFYISQKSYSNPAKRTACVKLLKYLSSREASVSLAQQTDMLSNVDISSHNVRYDNLTETAKEVVAAADTLVGPPDSYIKRSVWESVIVKNFPNMLKRNISPENLWKQAIDAGADEER
jgi:raffinose/stachyose/melibiose transport system substrate-binding protein